MRRGLVCVLDDCIRHEIWAGIWNDTIECYESYRLMCERRGSWRGDMSRLRPISEVGPVTCLLCLGHADDPKT